MKLFLGFGYFLTPKTQSICEAGVKLDAALVILYKKASKYTSIELAHKAFEFGMRQVNPVSGTEPENALQ